MIILDVFYVAIATIAVMGLLQLITFAVMRIMYPPEPKVIYREVQVPIQAPVQTPPNLPFSIGSPPSIVQPPPAFTEPKEEVQLPEYEARSTPASNSLRMDAGLPDGLQETRPPGL